MRITCYAIGLLLLLAVPAAATPQYVQTSLWQTGLTASTSCAMSLAGVVPGNNIVVIVAQGIADATAVYSVSDGVSYTEATAARAETNNREINVFYLLGAGSGTHSITVTQTSSTVEFKCIATEFSTGAGTTAALGNASTYDDAAGNTANHQGSAAGINTSAQTIVFSAGVLGASGTTLSPDDEGGTVFTELDDDGGIVWAGFYTSATALTGEVGPWDSSVARQGTNAIVSFHEVGAATVRNCMLLKVCP